MTWPRLLKIGTVLFLWGFSAMAGAQPSADLQPVLNRLEKNMTGVRTLAADFVQRQQLQAFDRTLEMKGHLYLQRPGRLAWQVNHPIRYRMVIKKGTLYQWDESTGQVQKLALDDNPQFTAVSRQLKLWFSGNYKSLAADYQVQLLRENPVQLRFEPRPQTMAAEMMRQVTVTFRQDERYIEKLELEDIHQDKIVIRFLNIRINPDLADSVWNVAGAAD